ncbi:unnamed protein product [Moneuplotes crassus]|uniref:CSC1/OSCA1-like 7TM region domain-containing protein n=1 Tax=Euplotes crassus TaxID=5936 RepID=A0AAD1Y5A9_EUPCR|nr:unnamed protein product [Moneuplotes crassus]
MAFMNDGPADLHKLFFFILFHFCVIILTVFLWRCIWLKRIGIELPSERREIIENSFNDDSCHTTKSFRVFWKVFKEKYMSLNENYWVKNCGVDAFLYLLLQRKVASLLFWIGSISFILSLFFNLASDETLDIQDHKWRNDWSIKVLYGNKDFIKGVWSWVQVILCCLITLWTLNTVYELKTQARRVYKRYVKHDYEWLKSRTIHVKGILKNDITGAMLENMLNDHLQDTEIPDYQKLTRLEQKRKELEDLSQLLGVKEPTFMRLCVRKKYRTEEYYKYELEEIEDQIRDELKKPIKSSGHAYIVFDSYYSMARCLQKYRETPCQTCKIMWSSCFDTITMRDRFDNDPRDAFIEFNDDEESPFSEYHKRGQTLLMSSAKDPVDIIWSNMGSSRGLTFFRRYLWNIIGFLLIMFVSTPVVVFKTFQTLSDRHLDLQFMQKIPYIDLVSSIWPPLIILCINMMLILLIDHSAVSEKRSAHSTFQSSIFNKALVYLHLNMVFVPFLSLQGQPIFRILEYHQVKTEYIREFTMINSSSFFVNLIIQYGVFTALFYFLRCGELMMNYISPWLVDYRRKYMNDSQQWRRKPDDIFQYGYFYSQMMTIFTISILYSSTAPMVIFSGCIFFFLRNITDSYTLLTVHRKEIESKLSIFHKILLCILMSLLAYQMFIFGYFYLNDAVYQTWFIGLILVMTILVIAINIEQMFDPMTLVKLDIEEEECDKFHSKVTKEDFNSEDFEKWKDSYTHPLLSNSAGSSASVFSTEIKKIIEDENKTYQYEDQSNDLQQSNKPVSSRDFERNITKEESKEGPRNSNLLNF